MHVMKPVYGVLEIIWIQQASSYQLSLITVVCEFCRILVHHFDQRVVLYMFYSLETVFCLCLIYTEEKKNLVCSRMNLHVHQHWNLLSLGSISYRSKTRHSCIFTSVNQPRWLKIFPLKLYILLIYFYTISVSLGKILLSIWESKVGKLKFSYPKCCNFFHISILFCLHESVSHTIIA